MIGGSFVFRSVMSAAGRHHIRNARLQPRPGDHEAELASAVEVLKKAYNDVRQDLGTEVEDQVRSQAWQKFISKVEEVAEVSLALEPADRSYRSRFTENYQVLFPRRDARLYRADVLEASLEGQTEIWANGTCYEVSDLTLSLAAMLQLRITTLLSLCSDPSDVVSVSSGLRTVLDDLDFAWAAFEEHYENELSVVEEKARSLVAHAAELDAVLHRLEVEAENSVGSSGEQENSFVEFPNEQAWSLPLRDARDIERPILGCISAASSLTSNRSRDDEEKSSLHKGFSHSVWRSLEPSRSEASEVKRLAASASERQPALERLLEQVSALNAAANISGKGRSDKGVEVLQAASAALAASDAVSCVEAAAAQRSIATRVLRSFAALRLYLADAGTRLLQVDPQLCNNFELVQHLNDWEEQWEMGSRFLLQPGVLSAITGIAAIVVKAQSLEPSLKSLCEDFDAEIFLILPRLVWLCALYNPATFAALPASVLPHRFTPGGGASAEGSRFLQQFNDLLSVMSWETLLRRAVLSPSQSEALPAFFGLLESFSMELQRHAAEDWNRCCNLLLQCVTIASKAAPAAPAAPAQPAAKAAPAAPAQHITAIRL